MQDFGRCELLFASANFDSTTQSLRMVKLCLGVFFHSRAFFGGLGSFCGWLSHAVGDLWDGQKDRRPLGEWAIFNRGTSG